MYTYSQFTLLYGRNQYNIVAIVFQFKMFLKLKFLKRHYAYLNLNSFNELCLLQPS